jgi:K+ transporter
MMALRGLTVKQNLVYFDHSVLKAFSPYFAGLWFVRNKTDGWKALGGILLAFTGQYRAQIPILTAS